MHIYMRYVFLAILPVLAGCATQKVELWRASDIAESPILPKGVFISSDKVKLVIDVKKRIAQVIPGVYADLLIASPKEPNAFASSDNGHNVIVITLGMFNLAGWDRDAYAAVIGHEFAHLALHHGAARARREWVNTVASAILGTTLSQAGVPMGGDVANITMTAFERTYTRDEEREADRTGFDYLVKAGFDPGGAIRLWEKMQTVPAGFSIPFLATHPLSQERIENMRALASTHAHRTEIVSPQATVPESTTPPSTSTTSSTSSRGDESPSLTDVQRRIAIGKQVWISIESLDLNKEPSRHSERLERIYKKDVLIVEEVSGDWIKVRSSSGSLGWIMRSWVVNVQ